MVMSVIMVFLFTFVITSVILHFMGVKAGNLMDIISSLTSTTTSIAWYSFIRKYNYPGYYEVYTECSILDLKKGDIGYFIDDEDPNHVRCYFKAIENAYSDGHYYCDVMLYQIDEYITLSSGTGHQTIYKLELI